MISLPPPPPANLQGLLAKNELSCHNGSIWNVFYLDNSWCRIGIVCTNLVKVWIIPLHMACNDLFEPIDAPISMLCFVIWVKEEVNCEGGFFCFAFRDKYWSKNGVLCIKLVNLFGLPVCTWHVNLRCHTCTQPWYNQLLSHCVTYCSLIQRVWGKK